LVETLLQGRGEELAPIQQVILIATPNLGSNTLSGLRNLFGRLSWSPQEFALRAFNEDISDMRAQVRKRVVEAKDKGRNDWPVPIQCYWGNQDNIVPRASARGSLPEDCFRVIDGDHFRVHRPDSPQSLNYQAFADCLMRPIGHPNIWEVDSFEVHLRVEPLGGVQQITARYGDKPPRTVETDNKARLYRFVTFSSENRCKKLFALNYGTRAQGWVSPKFSHENEALPSEKRLWTDDGVQVIYKFTPKAGEMFSLEAEIFKGFDENNRNAHFHLLTARYQTVRFRLDLSAYLEDGWAIKDEPKLYWHRETIQECDHLGKSRVAQNLREPSSKTPEGVWEWEMRRYPERIEEGVIDLVWDVAQAKAKPAGVQG
jgi:hypothetical protein